MLKSRLLHFTFVIGLAAIEAWGFNNEIRLGADPMSPRVTDPREAMVWKRVVEHVVVGREDEPRRAEQEGLSDATPTPVRRATRVVASPRPTTPPQRRQDAGQIGALSGRIQELSGTIAAISLTLSAVSSASQSLRQSADQAVRQAQESANQANQALTRAQTSAAEAAARATQQANDRLSQVSSSFSSQLASNLASLQASASNAIANAQAAASSSVASQLAIASSQIEDARAEATAVRGDADNLVAQLQRNSESGANLAIIVTIAVVGAIIVTSVTTWLIGRYRRARRCNRDVVEITNEKPFAVRGANPRRYTPTTGGSRFNPHGGGTGYPMDKLEMPSMGLSVSPPPESLNFGFGQAVSDYGDRGKTASSTAVSDGNGYASQGPPPPNWRLQRPANIKNAKAVRLIRVGSGKNKDAQKEEWHPPSSLAPTQPIPDPPKMAPQATENVRESDRYTILTDISASASGWDRE